MHFLCWFSTPCSLWPIQFRDWNQVKIQQIGFLKAEVMLLCSLVVSVSRLYCFKTTFMIVISKGPIYVTKICICSIFSLLKYLLSEPTADNWIVLPYWIFDVTSYCTVWGLWLTFLPWTILGVIIKRKSGEIPCPLAVEAFAAHLSYICKYDDKYSK